MGSIWMGALDFVIKSKLGKGPKLSVPRSWAFGKCRKALETNFYNAIPVAMITACIGTLLPTPVQGCPARDLGL